jgi:hypothetical protein
MRIANLIKVLLRKEIFRRRREEGRNYPKERRKQKESLRTLSPPYPRSTTKTL